VSQRRGWLITFEGGEGSGKSTQVRLLGEWLEACGLRVVRAREPGSTRLGEAIRQILLDPASSPMSGRTELLLYVAARAQLLEEVVRPALEGGAVVLLDRYEDSTYAYQGAGRGIPEAEVRNANLVATGGLAPDLTVLIDLPVEDATRRLSAQAGAEDRMEAEARSFHERVRKSFRTRSRSHPSRFLVVDGRQSPETIQLQVQQRVRSLLAPALSQRVQ
jgi:dTMP kinase